MIQEREWFDEVPTFKWQTSKDGGESWKPISDLDVRRRLGLNYFFVRDMAESGRYTWIFGIGFRSAKKFRFITSTGE